MTTTHATEHRILGELWGHEFHYTFTQLLDLVSAREQWISAEALGDALVSMIGAGWIERIDGPDSSVPKYVITSKGRARWAADEAKDVFASPIKPKQPLRVAVCDRKEPPATALICVTEEELDEWWEDLDADCKADAFAGFALRSHGGESHVYVEQSTDLRVPVAGTVGDSDNSLFSRQLRASIAETERKNAEAVR
jgi:hypothetical protein